jgi:hypothetical protein
MCGRFARFSDVHQMLGSLGAQWQGPDLLPNYNTAPSQQVLAVRLQDGRREAVQLRWGLIPSWAKDKSIGYRMINARADGIADKPAFRQPFRQQRCLIPADGFYEWRHDGGAKRRQVHRLVGRRSRHSIGIRSRCTKPVRLYEFHEGYSFRKHECTNRSLTTLHLIAYDYHDRFLATISSVDADQLHLR